MPKLKQGNVFFCKNEDHYIDQCKIVTGVNSRKEILSKGRCRFNCLKPGHIKKNCKAKVKCYRCRAEGSHHTVFLFSKNGTRNTIDGKNNHHNTLNETEETATCLVKNDTTILLQRASGCIMNITEDQFCVVNILLDTGSQQTFISDRVVNELKLKPLRKVGMRIIAFLNTKESKMKLNNEYEIVVKSLYTNERKAITALGVPKICTDIKKQSCRFAVEKYGFLQNLQLANQWYSESTNINLLIGSDTHWEFVTGEIKRDNDCTLVVQKSIFGYLVSGPLTKTNSSKPKSPLHVMKIVCKQDNCLNEKINWFWDLDTIGISDNETSVYDKLIASIKFENDRYSVALPFKENRPVLADNYQLCPNRLQKLKERLSKTPELLNEYNKVFDEYLNLGIIEKVKNEGVAGEVVYLPHKEVIKEDRSTTKLRIVFDASAKYKGTPSLNEVLCKGPCLNAELYSLLLKFRIYPIAITADTEKSYLQISINEEHRDFLRFL